jgi:hypothetical protein
LWGSSLLNDGTTWTASSWIAISAVSQVVELNWRAASGGGANDDGLTFWIDGNQVADLIGIDNRICDFVTYSFKFRLVLEFPCFSGLKDNSLKLFVLASSLLERSASHQTFGQNPLKGGSFLLEIAQFHKVRRTLSFLRAGDGRK